MILAVLCGIKHFSTICEPYTSRGEHSRTQVSSSVSEQQLSHTPKLAAMHPIGPECSRTVLPDLMYHVSNMSRFDRDQFLNDAGEQYVWLSDAACQGASRK